MKSSVNAAVWGLGLRTFRLARRLRVSGPLEPIFQSVALKVLPPSTSEFQVTLNFGPVMHVPAGYRDGRTLASQMYHPATTQVFRDVVGAAQNVIDLGAYIGYFSMLASTLVGPHGHVYAFEPEKAAYSYLVRNIEVNRAVNISPMNYAIDDGPKSMQIIRDPSGPESYVTVAAHPSTDNTVKVESLDRIFGGFRWPPVRLIKMNIEGSELGALKGMRGLSARNSDLVLIMEYNTKAMARAGATRSDLSQTLRQLGFIKCSVIDAPVGVAAEADLLPNTGVVCNLLLTK